MSESNDLQYKTKEEILDRLHDLVGECMHCGKHKCVHGTNTQLPDYISSIDIITAIDLDGSL